MGNMSKSKGLLAGKMKLGHVSGDEIVGRNLIGLYQVLQILVMNSLAKKTAFFIVTAVKTSNFIQFG
jgi:hypothetical protein